MGIKFIFFVLLEEHDDGESDKRSNTRPLKYFDEALIGIHYPFTFCSLFP
jgi:hypothetical protein